MSSEKYQIGDHVLILQNNNDDKIVGKIEEIFEENSQKFFKFNLFYSPDKTSAGKQSHNSKHELYKTDEIETEAFSKIISKCEVIKFDHYIKKLLANKDRKSHLGDNIFFFRQKYSVSDDHFAPDLPTTCYCDQIFNPDKNFIQCKKCKELIHIDCFLLGESKKCFNSSCNNNIENQLQLGQGNANTQINKGVDRSIPSSDNIKQIQSKSATVEKVMLNNKRKRSEENLEEKKENVHGKEKDSEISKTDNYKINQNTNTTPGNINKSANEDLYPNLSESRRKYLISLIEKIEKKNNALNKGSSSDERSRRTIKDRLSNCFLYGIEEIKENGEWSKMKNPELNRPEISEETAIRICNELSTEIETYVFLTHNGVNNSFYKKKLRTLYSNLSDYRNHELRFAILNDDIKPEEFVKMEAEELAPSSLKNRRIERQNKYFKEQVLMKEETKIIAKTHKGEAILTVDTNPNSNNEIFFSNQINTNAVSYNPVSLDENNCVSENEVITPQEGKAAKLSEILTFNINSPIVNSTSLSRNITGNLKGNNENGLTYNNEFDANTGKLSSQTQVVNKRKEIKYKNINSEQINFYLLLEDYKKENLINKFNDKLKNHLKHSTYNEIVKIREDKI